jgi:ESCRT-I complex subunit TSG101
MVSDQRVSRLLEQRLGGIYRDPARVNRDASMVLKSSIGTNLQPITTIYADETTGDTNTVLDLQGTIAIHYRGQTYQLLMDIYLIPQYPIRPPICYVRLAPNMYIKENHKHVTSDGKVYVPYLHEWNASTHNLVEMIVAISSIFSHEPPVFSRPPPAPTPPPPPPVITATQVPSSHPYTTVTSTTTSNSVLPTATVTGSTNTGSGNWRTQQEQLELALAREAEEANRAMEIVRQNEKDEEERRNAIQVYEQTQVQHLRNTINAKIQTYCRDQRTNIQQYIVEDEHDKCKLQNNSKLIQQQIQEYQLLQNTLQHQLDTINLKTNDIQLWLQENENNNNQQNNKTVATPKRTIDELVTTHTKIQQTMIQYTAESATISDILYYLDKALCDSKISLDLHLKHVRSLAKQQFYIKAHLLKLNKY